MRSVIFLSLFTFHFSLFSQKEIIPVATDFIVAKKYDEANHYLDSILKKHKKNIDALMMKGNVILNRAVELAPTPDFISADDESIFFETLTEKPKIISAETVFAIEVYWKKSLLLDSTRTDIRKGLCTIYAMSLQKEKLKAEISKLIPAIKNDANAPFQIAEYARKFKERNRFDEAMEIYQFIAKQFPNTAGIRCDIASEYFYDGKFTEALSWLDSCYNFKTIDETSFLNGAFIYSELGYYDDAQNVLNTYSHIYQRKMDGFYYGLRLFADSSEKYSTVLKKFTEEVDSNEYSNENFLSRLLHSYKDSFTISDYEFIAGDKEIPDYYKILIHSRAMKQFPNNCEPFIAYGIFQSSIKNYSSAVQFLEEDEECAMTPEQKEFRMLNSGYALYKFGENEKALNNFSVSTASKNAFNRSAARYFIAKILFANKKGYEGVSFLWEISMDSEQSKYSALATILSNKTK